MRKGITLTIRKTINDPALPKDKQFNYVVAEVRFDEQEDENYNLTAMFDRAEKEINERLAIVASKGASIDLEQEPLNTVVKKAIRKAK